MPRRVNLCPNPAFRNNTTEWYFPSGYARSTAVTTLPRTTGLKGTSAPASTIIGPQTPVSPGSNYCVSFSIHYTNTSGTNSFDYGIDWYDSSGSYKSSAPTLHRTSAPFGITERLEIGPVAAPSGAAFGVLTLDNIDSGCEVTALMVEQTATNGLPYFDGDSTGASWQGTAGNSASSILSAVDSWSWSDAAAMTATAAGPSTSDAFRWSESASVVASASTSDAWTWSESAMIISLGYDHRRGRVRINAFGFDPSALRAVVNSRPHGTGPWSPVRGGRVAIVGGAFSRSVDDYEFASGQAIDYQIVVLATAEGAPDRIVASAYATQPAIEPEVWLKFIPSPQLNRQVTLTGWDDVEQANNNATFRVRGRPRPIVVTDVHSSQTTSIYVRTETVQAGEALREALGSGLPAFLHTPVSLALPTMYVAIGDFSYVRPSSYSPVRRWTIALTEIDPPAPSVFGAAVTWQTILDGYATWADVIAAFPTWQDLIDG